MEKSFMRKWGVSKVTKVTAHSSHGTFVPDVFLI